jgi:hypothetical protein
MSCKTKVTIVLATRQMIICEGGEFDRKEYMKAFKDHFHKCIKKKQLMKVADNICVNPSKISWIEFEEVED